MIERIGAHTTDEFTNHSFLVENCNQQSLTMTYSSRSVAPCSLSPMSNGSPSTSVHSMSKQISPDYLSPTSSMEYGDGQNSFRHSPDMNRGRRVSAGSMDIPNQCSVGLPISGQVNLRPKTARAAANEKYEVQQALKNEAKLLIQEIKKQMPVKNIKKVLVVERSLESRATGRVAHVEQDTEMKIPRCQLEVDIQKQAEKKALRMVNSSEYRKEDVLGTACIV